MSDLDRRGMPYRHERGPPCESTEARQILGDPLDRRLRKLCSISHASAQSKVTDAIAELEKALGERPRTSQETARMKKLLFWMSWPTAHFGMKGFPGGMLDRATERIQTWGVRRVSRFDVICAGLSCIGWGFRVRIDPVTHQIKTNEQTFEVRVESDEDGSSV